MLINYRTNDAVLTICQNNREKSITISEVNDAAKELVGIDEVDLIGKSLDNILPLRIAELLTEYVEFEDDANDVGMVLSKVQSFSIIGKNSNEKVYRAKIVRMPSSGGSLFFSLVLQDEIGNRKNEAVRKVIQANFKGHEALDSQTDLPSRASLIKDIELMMRHNNAGEMLSCFSILQIDNYDKIIAQNGRKFCDELVRYVASTASRSLRPDDVVGTVGDGRIGILLVDIAQGSGRVALNRLRWQIASNPYIVADKEPIGLSVSISFCGVSGRNGDGQAIEQCEAALNNLPTDSHNILIEA